MGSIFAIRILASSRAAFCYTTSVHTTNYFDTFISVSEDCPVSGSEIPPAREPKSAVQIQYEMASNHPYEFTSDDIIYASHGERRGVSRDEFFSKGQACLRSSPLTKRYGWGIHSNSEGKVAIYPVGSPEYTKYSKDSNIKQLKGMRSRRT